MSRKPFVYKGFKALRFHDCTLIAQYRIKKRLAGRERVLLLGGRAPVFSSSCTVVVRRVLVARVVRDARLRLTVVEDAGELLCDCLVGIGIQVPICPKRGLYLLMPEPFLEEQWAFSHVDEK